MDKNAYKRMMEQAFPNAALIHRTKSIMRKKEPVVIKRSFSTAVVAVMAVLLVSTTALAAWYFLKPSEVADILEDTALSAAFNSSSAININASATSGSYTFTLLGIVSGKDISDQPSSSNGEILSDRSYVVTAIQKTDGTPMTSSQDDDFMPFYISPYVKGQKPWQVNAHTLGGGSVEIIQDGTLYHLAEFDNITMFSGSGVYIGVTEGRNPPDNQTFLINEQTGALSVNPDYSGISVLFDLPIDASLADPEKAQAFLDELLGDVDNAAREDRASHIDNDTPPVFMPDNTQASEGAAAGSFALDVGEGLVSQEEMTKAEFVEWLEKQNSENRAAYEKYLEYLDKGHTVTVFTYDNGSTGIQVNG